MSSCKMSLGLIHEFSFLFFHFQSYLSLPKFFISVFFQTSLSSSFSYSLSYSYFLNFTFYSHDINFFSILAGFSHLYSQLCIYFSSPFCCHLQFRIHENILCSCFGFLPRNPVRILFLHPAVDPSFCTPLYSDLQRIVLVLILAVLYVSEAIQVCSPP